MATVDRAFGERLKAAREAAGLTQVQLAAILAVAQKQISAWESGGMPRAGRLDAIAQAVGVSVGALFSNGPNGHAGQKDYGKESSRPFKTGTKRRRKGNDQP